MEGDITQTHHTHIHAHEIPVIYRHTQAHTHTHIYNDPLLTPSQFKNVQPCCRLQLMASTFPLSVCTGVCLCVWLLPAYSCHCAGYKGTFSKMRCFLQPCHMCGSFRLNILLQTTMCRVKIMYRFSCYSLNFLQLAGVAELFSCVLLAYKVMLLKSFL